MSRERGDQLAQMTATVAPRARSASVSCSPRRPASRSPCAASGRVVEARTRQAASVIGSACRERVGVTGDLREDRSARLVESAAVPVGHVEEDAMAEAVGSAAAQAALADDDEELAGVVEFPRAVAAVGDVVPKRGEILF